MFPTATPSPKFALAEGMWGDFRFKRADPGQESNRVFQHIKKYFMKEEATAKLLGYNDDFGYEAEELITRMLKDNMSLMVEDIEDEDEVSKEAL